MYLDNSHQVSISASRHIRVMGRSRESIDAAFTKQLMGIMLNRHSDLIDANYNPYFDFQDNRPSSMSAFDSACDVIALYRGSEKKNYFFKDLTIEAVTGGGAKSVLMSILEGDGDYYFYAMYAYYPPLAMNIITDYMIISLWQFRALWDRIEPSGQFREKQGPGGAFFRIPHRNLMDIGAGELVIARSFPIAMAHGMRDFVIEPWAWDHMRDTNHSEMMIQRMANHLEGIYGFAMPINAGAV